MALLTLAGCGRRQVVIGSKKFTESYVLGEIAKRVLHDDGVEAVHKQGMGGTLICWQALKAGEISLYPDYTGTISKEILKLPGAPDAAKMRAELAKFGVGMGGELGFNNTYALVMPQAKAEKLGIRKISDLRSHPELVVAVTHEFLNREDGWKPLSARYGLAMRDVRGIDHSLAYQAMASGSIDITDAYSTDAKIATEGLRVLADDLGFFPQYKAVFLYRLNMPERALRAIRKLEGTLPDERMTKLNAAAEETKDYGLAAAAYFGEKRQAQSPEREIPILALQHLKLVAESLVLAILVGLPLGIVASRPGALSQAILGITGVIQTIPSLALLALLVPIPGFGIRDTTAIFALFLYSLLPIVRNTATGLQDIPLPLRESAAALGLSPRAQLLKVLLPMASRSILAGVKTSAVINVGTATLAALIGAGGLGQLIMQGLDLLDNRRILAGAIPAAALALLVQLGFDLLDRVLIPRGLRLPAQRT